MGEGEKEVCVQFSQESSSQGSSTQGSPQDMSVGCKEGSCTHN